MSRWALTSAQDCLFLYQDGAEIFRCLWLYTREFAEGSNQIECYSNSPACQHGAGAPRGSWAAPRFFTNPANVERLVRVDTANDLPSNYGSVVSGDAPGLERDEVGQMDE